MLLKFVLNNVFGSKYPRNVLGYLLQFLVLLHLC